MIMDDKFVKGAKIRKDDEFYTRYEDCPLFIDFYSDYISDKRIICPADSDKSQIYRYLLDKGYNVDRTEDIFNTNYNDYDIIITNPPFSIFRKVIDFFMSNNLKFIIIGPYYGVGYKIIYNLMSEDRLLVFNGHITKFNRPDGSIKQAATLIYTNLGFIPEPPYLELKEDDGQRLHDKYSDLRRTYDIQYTPISFFYHYNPHQFKVVGEKVFPGKFKRIAIQLKEDVL